MLETITHRVVIQSSAGSLARSLWRAIPLAIALVALFALPVTALAETVSRVRHVPPAQAAPDAPLELVVDVGEAWEATLEVRYRPVDTGAWDRATFARRDQEQYVAMIPAQSVQPPGLEYFLVSVGQATYTHFASPERPHLVNVFRSAGEVRRARHLARHGGHRAQVRVAGEYVDYGSRDIAGKVIPDRYYRVDAAVGYRVLSFPLRTLRFGYTHLIGETPTGSLGDDGMCQPGDPVDVCSVEAGLKGGGWFELEFVLRDGLEIDTRGMVMATQEGFNVGGRAEVRIGDSQGSHIGLGGELIADVGFSGFFRLGWGTVPGFPMAATVEVTDFPAPHRATSVRLFYDVARSLPGGFRFGARVGYQARDQQIGGATAGLNAIFDF